MSQSLLQEMDMSEVLSGSELQQLHQEVAAAGRARSKRKANSSQLFSLLRSRNLKALVERGDAGADG